MFVGEFPGIDERRQKDWMACGMVGVVWLVLCLYVFVVPRVFKRFMYCPYLRACPKLCTTYCWYFLTLALDRVCQFVCCFLSNHLPCKKLTFGQY